MPRFTAFALAGFCLLLTSLSYGDDTQFPKAGWMDTRDPLASPLATPGGEINYYLGPEPSSYNYFLEPSTISSTLFGMMYESLLDGNPVSLDDEPGLAERWTVSEDKKVFTFWLDDRARWSDGKPITANDVKWTYDTILKSPKTGPHKVDLERFSKVEVLDERTVRFTAKEVHWSNIYGAGSLLILPQHAFAKKTFEELNWSFPVVSGPYQIKERKEGQFVSMARRKDWWAKDHPRNQNKFNFSIIKFKFFAERDTAYQAFKKGDLDVFPVGSAKMWAVDAAGETIDRGWVVKQTVHNYHPIGFQGWVMNMRRPQFADLQTRQALACLVDREKMNKTLMYQAYAMHQSYFEDLYSPKDPCPNPATPFDKAKARQLLADAGWKINPKTGLLERGGQPFVLKFLARSNEDHKFLAIFRDDLKDVGIELKVDQKDWAAWMKDMDEFNFDMTWAAWSAGVRKDPEHLWLSSEGKRPGGFNVPGFSHPLVDALIEQQKSVYDIQVRHEICRKIDSIITKEYPYVLLWYLDYNRLLYWNKFGTPPQLFSKYGDEDSALVYWWFDADSEADLSDAIKDRKSLPRKPAAIIFDEAFKP